LSELASGLSDKNYTLAVQLAEMPMQLRGFGHVKDRNRENLASQRKALLDAFRGGGADVVKIVERAA
jgi:indolepyruvate ferredoxin oxidoreductase